MHIVLTDDERNVVAQILEEHNRITQKKGLDAEHAYMSGLLNKVLHEDSEFGINEADFLKEILENCTPDELRRVFGVHEITREREILAEIVDRFGEMHIMT